jgi:16S rRNA (adenine1518-N6/adenine1519-N6)-dimethyltransferase
MKRKGQHFLVDGNIIKRIADYAELVQSDRVLEIGPGEGNLTKVLAAGAGRVFAVEIDPFLAEDLSAGFHSFHNVSIIKGDALKVKLPDYNKIVSNLPYQISTKITLLLLSRPFDLAVLMYQREFVRRMLARPGTKEYGRLGMIAGHLCDAELLEIVPRNAFSPMPEVTSAIVRLRPRSQRSDVEAEMFIRFVERLFNNRRKKIKKALMAMGVPAARQAGLNVDAALLERRPEELMPDEAAKLAEAILQA